MPCPSSRSAEISRPCARRSSRPGADPSNGRGPAASASAGGTSSGHDRQNGRLNYNSKVKSALEIAPAQGKLGILLVGLGAVSTTTIAGVIAIRKGLAKPIGSLTQMGTIRLGKRTEGRSPRISEVVPLSGLDDVVFVGWDIFDDDCYAAAKTAGVLEPALLQQIRPELEQIRPWPAVFDQRYVKRLEGPNVKKGKNKRDLAEQVMEDIRLFKKDNNLD